MPRPPAKDAYTGSLVPGLLISGRLIPGLLISGVLMPGLLMLGSVVLGLLMPELFVSGLIPPGLLMSGLLISDRCCLISGSASARVADIRIADAWIGYIRVLTRMYPMYLIQVYSCQVPSGRGQLCWGCLFPVCLYQGC